MRVDRFRTKNEIFNVRRVFRAGVCLTHQQSTGVAFNKDRYLKYRHICRVFSLVDGDLPV